MRRVAPLVAWLIVAVVALVPVQGHAATRNATAYSTYLHPPTLTAAAGDTIRWYFEWTGCGYGGSGCTSVTHNLRAYQNASFTSGDQSSGSYWSTPFAGGAPVRYRCTYHSTLDQTDRCTGMCGRIVDPGYDAIPPTVEVTSPAQNEAVVVSPLASVVRFRGTASDALGVESVYLKTYDALNRPIHATYATCTGCGTTAATWERTLPLLVPGVYYLDAMAEDANGNWGYAPRVRFILV